MSLAIVFFGLLLGGMSVFLPPMVPIGFAAIPVLLLIWATPELRRVPTDLVRIFFFCAVFVETSIPNYYTVQVAGLPWISIRRLTVLCLIVFFSIAIAGSASARKKLHETLSANKLLYLCFAGYLGIAFLSLFTAQYLAQSIAQMAEYILNWYVPAFGCILAMRNMEDVRKTLKLLAIFSLLVTALGIVDFIGQHNYAVDVIPKPLLNAMMADNPSMVDLVYSHPMRNGYYRASSIFNVPLSYGEFAAMTAPIGGYFMFHARNYRERILGLLVVFGSMTSLFVSGARGGSIAFLVAMPLFLFLWVIRAGRAEARSLVGPIAAGVVFMGTTALFALILAWGRLRIMVLGGGDTQASDDARWVQAHMAWPHILANPVTGHGIGNSGEIIGYRSPGGQLTVDSSILTILVETGVTGFVLFFGMLGFAAWSTSRIYLTDKSREADLGATLACSLIAFAVYRTVLSQRENQPLMFILVGMACVFIKYAADRAAQKKLETAKAGASKPVRATNEPGPIARPLATGPRWMNT
ncbi:O-antigen ligase family protein [Rhodoblastus sp.]|uniref:O-antigen ligase family protein n=1 Tax=Rhodoblastus sp. TaxID=1962975 RepID=UPI003F9ABD5E